MIVLRSKQSVVGHYAKVKQLFDCRQLSSLKGEPSQPIPGRKPKYVSAKEALSVLQSGDLVSMQSVAGAPKALAKGMLEVGIANNLTDVSVYHLMSLTIPDYLKPEYSKIFRVKASFTSGIDREAINSGRADYIPGFLSEKSLFFRRGLLKPKITMLQVTPPDENGFLSMGPSVTSTRDSIKVSKYVIGEINPRLPRTIGDSIVHESQFDFLVQNETELDTANPKPLTDVEKMIGKHIAENLIEDGSTLQMGIGGIPDAVLAQCKNHKDLGIHTEMFSDGVINLIESGAITNRLKNTEKGFLTATFIFGSTKFYDYFHNNPYLIMRTADYTNDQHVIASNPKVTAINSCIEMDITGQAASDTVGTKIFSGFGGQVDFLRGAALSYDGKGKPILALSSTTNKGESKIVPFLKHGAGVTSTRAHVHYVVTEYGIASLFGQSIRQRAHQLISIAHPDHRENLEKAAFERLKCMPSKD